MGRERYRKRSLMILGMAQKLIRYSVYLVVIAGCVQMFSESALAGFEWRPPPAEPKHSSPGSSEFSSDIPKFEQMGGYFDMADPSLNGGRSAVQSFARYSPFPHRSRTYETVEGFGRDLPLSLALRQIAPPEYSFRFDGVDPQETVSWEGGKPWNEVVMDMLDPIRAEMAVTPNHVFIVPKGRLNAPNVAPPDYWDTAGAGQHGMLPPYGQEESRRVSWSHDGGKPHQRPMEMQGHGEKVMFDGPRQKNTLQRAGPMPLHSREGGQYRSRSARPQIGGTQYASNRNMQGGIQNDGFLDHLSETGLNPIQVKAGIVVSKDQLNRTTLDPDQTGNWTARAGGTLQNVLAQWSRQAGVQLYWNANVDYPLLEDMQVNGTFEEAVVTILGHFKLAQPVLSAQLYPNLPEGPSVLLVRQG